MNQQSYRRKLKELRIQRDKLILENAELKNQIEGLMDQKKKRTKK